MPIPLVCDKIADSFIWLWPTLAILAIHFRYALTEYRTPEKQTENYILFSMHVGIILGMCLWIYVSRSKFCPVS